MKSDDRKENKEVRLWRRIKLRHAVLIVMMMLLPSVLAAYLIATDAERQAKHSAELAGGLILRQIEVIVDSAIQTSDQLLPLAGRPCPEVQHTLDEVPPRQPYLRAVSLLRERELYCGTEGGLTWKAEAERSGYGKQPFAGRHDYMLAGAELVPDRPALVLTVGQDDGRGVAVTIDGQYMMDLLVQSFVVTGVKAELNILDGPVLAATPTPTGDTESAVYHLVQVKSTRYPLSLDLSLRSDNIAAVAHQLWRLYGLLIVAVSSILGYLLFYLTTRRLSMAAEIRRGMRYGEFSMVYQPIVDLRNGRCAGVEALMRWNKPGTGLIRPEFVFDVAQEQGLAIPLSKHLFGLIAADIATLTLSPGFHVGVNIVPEHLDSVHLLEDVSGMFDVVARRDARLILEITERSPLPDTDQVHNNLAALKALGGSVAIDDFGTGHSALAYLEKYSADYIKIDRGFVSAISAQACSAPVLELIIALGSRLRVALIAEGIETRAQADYLCAQQVRYGQGFFYARPMPAIELQRWLQT